MISPKKIYELAIRAYPSTYRQQHGDELVDTALKLHDGKWSPIETFALLSGGVQTTLRLPNPTTRRKTWTMGIQIALVLSIFRGFMVVTHNHFAVIAQNQTLNSHLSLLTIMAALASAALALAVFAGGRIVAGTVGLLGVVMTWAALDIFVYSTNKKIVAIATIAFYVVAVCWLALRSTIALQRPSGMTLTTVVTLFSYGLATRLSVFTLQEYQLDIMLPMMALTVVGALMHRRHPAALAGMVAYACIRFAHLLFRSVNSFDPPDPLILTVLVVSISLGTLLVSNSLQRLQRS